jgi:SAM-dependent methyltransferase
MRRSLLLLLLLAACESSPERYEPLPEDSVKPGINASFLDPDLEVPTFVARFEGESREVFRAREDIVAAMHLSPGQAVVDVGAGTGPFLGPLSRAVGGEGRVYALDIAQGFVDHMAQRAADEGLSNVEARLCSENAVDLPARSVDVALICDVYHHFEYPRSSMNSLRYALRPGGEVVIVDFERIPGVSREWILGHVRAGKEEVIAELSSFGFDLIEECEVPGLEENWVARFRRR